MEIKNEQLPFLNVLVTCNSDGTLGHAVYHKPTYTNHYLFPSHHHPLQKTAVSNTLPNRALAIYVIIRKISKIKSSIKNLQQIGYLKKQHSPFN